MRSTVRLLSVGAVAAATLLAAPSAFAADSAVTQAVTGGTLTASAADLTLAGVTTTHSAQNSTGTMTITADDSTGTGAGWNVTEQVSNLIYTGSYTGTDIPAANLAITSVGAVTATAGQAVDNTGTDSSPTGPQSANKTSGVTGTLDTARTVFRAGVDYGLGTYTLPVNLNLEVPADSRVGTYTGTLTTTIASAP